MSAIRVRLMNPETHLKAQLGAGDLIMILSVIVSMIAGQAH
ncbi:MAG: hypothetical protein WA426_00030 [Silvibacterium sp.]